MNKYSLDARKLNERCYENGVPIKISNPYFYTRVSQVNRLENILDKYSEKFGEPAVIAEWGQPFGGPSDGFKVHRESKVNILLETYERARVEGIYPKLGACFDYAWLSKKKECLEKSSCPAKFDFGKYFELAFG